jgi:hypothetical protein
MLRLIKINNHSEFGSDLVGGVGPSLQFIEIDAAKSSINLLVELMMGGVNPWLLSLSFLMPIVISYFGPTKRIYTTQDIQEMFNDIKAEYQMPYKAYSMSKQISPILSNSPVYTAQYGPAASNIDYSKYDINKNVWKLSGYNGWDGLGYRKSRYMMLSNFGIKLTQYDA